MEKPGQEAGTKTAQTAAPENGEDSDTIRRLKEMAETDPEIARLLEAGHPIICSVRPGDFARQGHFIVLAGAEDGMIRVHDPNSRIRSETLWDYETLEGQINNLWKFEKQQ